MGIGGTPFRFMIYAPVRSSGLSRYFPGTYPSTIFRSYGAGEVKLMSERVKDKTIGKMIKSKIM